MAQSPNTDQDTAHVSLEARLNLEERTLALDAQATEMGGLLASLTGLAGAAAATARRIRLARSSAIRCMVHFPRSDMR